jgi:hypothetical protein
VPVARAYNLSYSEGRDQIRRIEVRSQPWQIVHKTLSRKNPSQKKASGVAKVKTMSSNPRNAKKKPT